MTQSPSWLEDIEARLEEDLTNYTKKTGQAGPTLEHLDRVRLLSALKLAIDVLEDVPEKYLTREQIESLEKLKRGEG